MSYRLRVMAVLLGVMTTGLAETTEGQQGVSMELLEFLGDWDIGDDTGSDDWEGPEFFEDDAFDQLYDENGTDTDGNATAD